MKIPVSIKNFLACLKCHLQKALKEKNITDYSRQRKDAVRMARQFWGPKKKDWGCALCNRRYKPDYPVEIAHIFPLEEGGSNELANLIPLCNPRKGKIQAIVTDVLKWAGSDETRLEKSLEYGAKKLHRRAGCHGLLDSGFISREEIRRVRRDPLQWGKYLNIRTNAMSVPIKCLDDPFSPGARVERVKRKMNLLGGDGNLRKAKADCCSFEVFCDAISDLRRLLDNKRLEIAKIYCNQLDDLLKRSRYVNLALKSRFYYEFALLCMVQENPDLDCAESLLRKSCAIAAGGSPSWAMSRIEYLRLRGFRTRPLSAEECRKLIKKQDKCLQILDENKGASSGRWRLNTLIHRAQLQVKAGLVNDAWRTLEAARSLFDAQDIRSGWDLFAHVHLSTTLAAVYAKKGRKDKRNYNEALRLAYRSVDVMSHGRGKRPEGYKDVGQCTAYILKQLKMNREAKEIKAKTDSVEDGRSGFWV